MPEVASSVETQEVDIQGESDPRAEDKFRTVLLGDGPQKDVLAHIFYTKVAEDGAKPTEKDLPFLKPEFTDDRTVVIHDARGLDKTVDENGFEYFNHPKPDADYSTDDSIKRVYYPAMMQMIKEKFGASEVMIFNHRIRNVPYSTQYGTDYNSYTGPVLRPHVDFAPVHAPMFIKRIRPQTYQEYEGRRWQVINFWRPLSTVLRDPLAVADARTVPETDELVHVAYPGTPYETKSFLTMGGVEGMHRWYYYPEQKPDEVLAFKIYDSAPKHADARVVPHTSFRWLDVQDAPTRYSIEVRCFLAYD
ncbi:hypothetical protein CDV55_104666 [Aspergillus turcosus]|nr:hypothetical protein CDV55_104666 [Aspergillus turcosus]